MKKRVIEGVYTTLFKIEDEDDVFLGISASIEKEIERVVGVNHHFDCSFSLKHHQLSIVIDTNIIINARLTEYKYVSSEPIFNMVKCKKIYGVTEDEIKKIYKLDNFLKNVREPYVYNYQCVLELEIAEETQAKYKETAENLLDAVKLK